MWTTTKDNYTALDVSDKEEPENMHELPPVVSASRGVRPLWFSVFAVALLSVVVFSGQSMRQQIKKDIVREKTPPVRVLMRLETDYNGAGLGSAVTQLRGSAMYASLFNRSLVINGWSTSHHGYDVDPILSTYQGPLSGRFCVMSKHCTAQAHLDLVNNCAEVITDDLQACMDNTQQCDVLIDDFPWKRAQHCGGKPLGWIHDSLLRAAELGHVKPVQHDCAWHFRWGDLTAHHEPIDRITKNDTMELVSAFAKQHGCASIAIFMQHASPEVLAPVSIPYTIIDSGDVIADIHALASARIIVLSDSALGPVIIEVAENADILAQKSSDKNYLWTEIGAATSNTIHFVEDVVKDNVR